MNRSWMVLAASAFMLCSVAQAADAPPRTGEQTRALLELQKRGSAAAPQKAPKPVPGEVADRVYQRYLNSFSHPIPASFPRESFGGGSGQGK